MHILYLDCFSGISGDMTVGALLDLGLPFEVLKEQLELLKLPGYRLACGRGFDGALSATEFTVELLEEPVTAGQAQAAPRFRPVVGGRGALHSHGPGQSHAHDAGATHTHAHDASAAHSHAHDLGAAHTHAQDAGAGHAHDAGAGHSHVHDAGAGHAHGPGAVHRAYRDIRAMIADSALPAPVKERAQAIFLILARAEGRIHGIPPEEVTFHEVGAIDSIVDIVGAAIGLHHLEIDQVVCSPLPVSRGMIECQHGLLPLPAPATLELMRGAQIYDSGRNVELVTPTGAAIVAAMASSFGGLPSMRVNRIGYGLGRRRGHATPNALRMVLGEQGEPRWTGVSSPAQAVMIEANIDDMNPQFFEPLLEKLLQEGALDVALLPVQMKKGRPATLVQVLCEESARERMLSLLLAESTTIGARYYPVARECLERRIVRVNTPFGEMPVKLGIREGQVWNVMPEFEDCRRAAGEWKLPLKQVHQEVLRCALEQGFGPPVTPRS